MVQMLKNFLRRAEGLLKYVVDSDQTLHRLVEHQQGNYEAGEIARCERTGLDLRARVGEQSHDGNRAKHLDDRRRNSLLQHVTHVGLQKPARGIAESPRFVSLSAEGLHHGVAAEGLL